MNQFRLLKAEEIDARVGNVYVDPKNPDRNGVTVLLYKDARCDMAILDETVGPMNWKKVYTRNNANCILSIWDDEKKQWIEKEDAGSSSNNFEKDKTLASDSFKRAAVSWGIGRELYTAPQIFIPAQFLKCFNVEEKRCTDKFAITKIEYDDTRNISELQIKVVKTGAEFNISNKGTKNVTAAQAPEVPAAVEEANDKAAANIKAVLVTTEVAQEKAKEEEVDLTNSLPFD